MIKVTSESTFGGGANGLYWQYDKHIGIKLCLLGNYQTRKEGKWLKELNKIVPGLFPKFYGFLKVDFDGEKCLAYKMEHIEGDHRRIDSYPSCILKKCWRVVKHLEKMGLKFEDFDGNVIITNTNHVRLIDADPNYFYWKGKRP